MKTLIFAAAAFASIALSGCAGLGLSVAPGSTPSPSQDALTKALADKLVHCGITGSISIGVGGMAGTGTGFANTAQLNCPGQPYSTTDVPSVTPLSQFTGAGGSFGGGGATGLAPPQPASSFTPTTP